MADPDVILLSQNETEQLAALASPTSMLEAMRVAGALLDGAGPAPDRLIDLVRFGQLTRAEARWVYIAGHVLAALGLAQTPLPLPDPDRCRRCAGRGIVPDWASWHHEFGEPYPKPCPDCSGQEAVDA